ncbi:hypothetical protein HAX54_036158 [Datura stramonium]|uniref:Uncharacterized protein n=1 Tax=Datura stramonium TaxID=4076 RepID=A0ABS8SG39_DATST|nr:hypothetical protein [Datura stramonium]
MVRNRGRSGDVVRWAVGRSGTRKKKREREGCWGGWDVVEATVCFPGEEGQRKREERVRRRWRLWSFPGCWSRWVYEEHERGLVKMEVLRRFGVAAVRRSRRPETDRWVESSINWVVRMGYWVRN